jgi:hypothetical protein
MREVCEITELPYIASLAKEHCREKVFELVKH